MSAGEYVVNSVIPTVVGTLVTAAAIGGTVWFVKDIVEAVQDGEKTIDYEKKHPRPNIPAAQGIVKVPDIQALTGNAVLNEVSWWGSGGSHQTTASAGDVLGNVNGYSTESKAVNAAKKLQKDNLKSLVAWKEAALDREVSAGAVKAWVDDTLVAQSENGRHYILRLDNFHHSAEFNKDSLLDSRVEDLVLSDGSTESF